MNEQIQTYRRELHTIKQDYRLHIVGQPYQKHHVRMHRRPEFDEVVLKKKRSERKNDDR